MANNITIDTITGAPVAATDDVGGIHYQYVKHAFGPDNTATIVQTGTGLPVTLETSSNNVGNVGVTSVVPGTGATALGKAVDNAAGASDVGVAVLGIRTDTPATITPQVGDYAPFRLDPQGNLRVNVSAGGAATQVDDTAFTPGTSEILVAGFTADESSTDSIDEGDMGAARMTLDRKQVTAQYAHAVGGWTPYSYISDGSDAAVVKASAGQIGWLVVTNNNAAACYLKFYNSASAPTLGSGTPVLRFMVPGYTNGFTVNLGAGAEFTTGISFGIVTTLIDSGSTSVAANEVLVNLGYK